MDPYLVGTNDPTIMLGRSVNVGLIDIAGGSLLRLTGNDHSVCSSSLIAPFVLASTVVGSSFFENLLTDPGALKLLNQIDQFGCDFSGFIDSELMEDGADLVSKFIDVGVKSNEQFVELIELMEQMTKALYNIRASGTYFTMQTSLGIMSSCSILLLNLPFCRDQNDELFGTSLEFLWRIANLHSMPSTLDESRRVPAEVLIECDTNAERPTVVSKEKVAQALVLGDFNPEVDTETGCFIKFRQTDYLFHESVKKVQFDDDHDCGGGADHAKIPACYDCLSKHPRGRICYFNKSPLSSVELQKLRSLLSSVGLPLEPLDVCQAAGPFSLECFRSKLRMAANRVSRRSRKIETSTDGLKRVRFGNLKWPHNTSLLMMVGHFNLKVRDSLNPKWSQALEAVQESHDAMVRMSILISRSYDLRKNRQPEKYPLVQHFLSRYELFSDRSLKSRRHGLLDDLFPAIKRFGILAPRHHPVVLQLERYLGTFLDIKGCFLGRFLPDDARAGSGGSVPVTNQLLRDSGNSAPNVEKDENIGDSGI